MGHARRLIGVKGVNYRRRSRCEEQDVVELRSLQLHWATPPPAEEGQQGQARGEEGEGRGFGDGHWSAE